MFNHLQNQTSPYLLQHAENPVEWYPWGEEAFRRARDEDKPVFLSIGYSTCHWCHVMARESFEDKEIAALLNRHFISVKVDKEERPDIDAIYMAVCQTFTGSGGWPTSIFMTADQKPFFAGTYFPKHSRGGMIGLWELLNVIHEKWENDRCALLKQADEIVGHLSRNHAAGDMPTENLPGFAVEVYRQSYDRKNGGFGRAPKFPTPHNLLFLLTYYERYGDAACLEMAEQTLVQMYRGGLFDHFGFGFFRYSTDARFLIPHFEKMLYDNALLIMAYCKAYTVTKKSLYLEIAEKTAAYILREMTDPKGGFYSAQDADSDGEEGKYYLFTPEEVFNLLGQTDGAAFCRQFGITASGNFEGKSIPNLLAGDLSDRTFDPFLERICQYRRKRCVLHLDDKILTSWNALMISAMCWLYQAGGNVTYLNCAKRADRFIWDNLYDGDTLFVSFREGQRGVKGFLDDYAACLFAQLALYGATLEAEYLERANCLCRDVYARFHDNVNGGFYLYGEENEALILRPKETYDGALPSGNSLMAWNLVRLSQLTSDEACRREAEEQLNFLAAEAARYPAGHAMFLLALLNHENPPPKVTVALAKQADAVELPVSLSPDTAVLMTGQGNVRGAPDYFGTICPEEVEKGERPAFFTGASFSCFPSGQREYGSRIVLLSRKECAMAEATCREEYTYQVGKITFIVTPVYKDEGEPMRDILLKLMLADLESA